MIMLVCIIHRALIVSQLLAVNAIKVTVKVHRISGRAVPKDFNQHRNIHMNGNYFQAVSWAVRSERELILGFGHQTEV